MNTRITALQEPTSLDGLGLALARELDRRQAPLSHEVSERLRVARLQALAARPHTPQRARAAQPVMVLAQAGDAPGGRWQPLWSLLPLLMLLAGLYFWPNWYQQNALSELAEIDTALLIDDLPPAAYADPGFAHFLRLRRQGDAPQAPAQEDTASE